jgi:DNA-binding response OmpR family regulator
MAKILLIDDEAEILLLTSRILEKEGFKMVTAKNGKDGLKVLENDSPDLILLDIMMPGEDGWEIARKIKSNEKTKNIPIAMFTVRVSEKSVQKSMEYALADAQIDKPFETEELLKVINDLLIKSGYKNH